MWSMSDATPPHAAERNDPNIPPSPPAATSDDRTLALLAHLLGIFTWFIGALVIWIVKKDSPSQFAADQAKEALNFQITLIIAWAIAGLLVCVGIGILILPLIWVLNIVFCIIACIAAGNGQPYRYPFAIRLIK
jgi:uncharacterized protein